MTTERPLPVVTPRTEPYWLGGADDKLIMQRCQQCRAIVHPPTILCPHDHHPELRWEPVSGRGRVEAWSENLHQWFPGLEPPYLAALVALDEDPRSRILTNLVDVEPSGVTNGMAVRAVFLRYEDDLGEVWLPCFAPEPEGA